MLREVESQPRDRIIDTALRLFYEQGYLATGINQIIAESQVAKATFYSHFSSKENLINTSRKIPLLIKQTQGGVNYSVPRLAFYFSKHDTIYTRQSCLSNKFPLISHSKYSIFSPMIVHSLFSHHI